MEDLKNLPVKGLPVLIKEFRYQLDLMGANIETIKTIVLALRGSSGENAQMETPDFPEGQLGEMEKCLYFFKEKNYEARRLLSGIEISVLEVTER